MAIATTPLDAPASSQYDPDSAPNKNQNCGPTTVVNVVRYHRDIEFPIEATRDLATSADGRGTNTSQRKVMLDKRGVPSSVRHLTAAEVKQLLNGRRAFDIALLMSKIPLSIRKRPFSGSHSVEAVAVGELKGERGIWVNNPDFHRDRDEPHRYFYPDRYWIPAFYALGGFWGGKQGGWAVVPDKDKVIPTRVPWRERRRTRTSVNARSGPGEKFSVVKVLPAGTPFTSIELEKTGQPYIGPTGAQMWNWLSFSLNGRVVWVARGWTVPA